MKLHELDKSKIYAFNLKHATYCINCDFGIWFMGVRPLMELLGKLAWEVDFIEIGDNPFYKPEPLPLKLYAYELYGEIKFYETQETFSLPHDAKRSPAYDIEYTGKKG